MDIIADIFNELMEKHSQLQNELLYDRINYYEDKIKNGDFTVQDVPVFLYDFHDGLCFEYTTKAHKFITSYMLAEKTAGQNLCRQIMPQIAEYFECKVDEIYFNEKLIPQIGQKSIPYKIILGNLDLAYSDIVDLGSLEEVMGNINLQNSLLVSLGKLSKVGGDLIVKEEQIILKSSNIKSTNSINNLNIRNKLIIDADHLESVDGEVKIDSIEIPYERFKYFVSVNAKMQKQKDKDEIIL